MARERAGYTLDQLATLTGLSKAHLSRLESAERQPSIAALLTFSGTLGVPVSWLLGEEEATTTPLSIHAGGEPRHRVTGVEIAPCSGYAGSEALEALRMTISPDRSSGPSAHHRGEEWLYVVQGKLRLEYDGVLHEVPAGACAHFDAERPHRLEAIGRVTEVLIVAAEGSRALWSAHR